MRNDAPKRDKRVGNHLIPSPFGDDINEFTYRRGSLSTSQGAG